MNNTKDDEKCYFSRRYLTPTPMKPRTAEQGVAEMQGLKGVK
jgi:hypothetical protein